MARNHGHNYQQPSTGETVEHYFHYFTRKKIEGCLKELNWVTSPFLSCIAVLLVPKMTVNVEGDPIQVGFSTTLSDMTVNLNVWQEGDEQNVRIFSTFPFVIIM